MLLVNERNRWDNLGLEFGEIHLYGGNLLIVKNFVLYFADSNLIQSLILDLKDIPVKHLILDKILLPQERLT
jgi:hypothetical protein